jgi:hypothetical protein
MAFQWDALLEVPVELHDAITDGFQLVRLPRVGQQELPAMATGGTGRDVEASASPEIRDRPAAPTPPLAEGPEHAATEQNIPFRDRWHVRRHVRRSFSQPGTGEQRPAKAVSLKACCSKAFRLRTQALIETPPV